MFSSNWGIAHHLLASLLNKYFATGHFRILSWYENSRKNLTSSRIHYKMFYYKCASNLGMSHVFLIFNIFLRFSNTPPSDWLIGKIKTWKEKENSITKTSLFFQIWLPRDALLNIKKLLETQWTAKPSIKTLNCNVSADHELISSHFQASQYTAQKMKFPIKDFFSKCGQHWHLMD